MKGGCNMDAKTMVRLDNIKLVKQLTADGLTAVEIAKLLNLSESTVRAYQNS
jgi:transposase